MALRCVSGSNIAEICRLDKDLIELRRANEIIRTPSAFFAAKLTDLRRGNLAHVPAVSEHGERVNDESHRSVSKKSTRIQSWHW